MTGVEYVSGVRRKVRWKCTDEWQGGTKNQKDIGEGKKIKVGGVMNRNHCGGNLVKAQVLTISFRCKGSQCIWMII